MAAVSQGSQPMDGFPQGIWIGHFTNSADGTDFPALLPTCSGALLVSGGEELGEVANRVVEMAVAGLLYQLPLGRCEVSVLDTELRKRFHYLGQLPPKYFKLFHNHDAIAGCLGKLEAKLHFRHHQCLGGAVRTLEDYNQGARYPEAYLVLVARIGGASLDAAYYQRLSMLLKVGMEAGLYCVFLNHADGDLSNCAEYWALVDSLRSHHPEIMLENSSLSLKGTAPAVVELNEHCERHQLTLVAPSSAEFVVADLLANVSSEPTLKNSFSAPIGYTINGQQPINLEFGKKNRCYHALLLGVTGSGKTNLLNYLLVQIAEKYTAQEVQLYLMDYKEGIDFDKFHKHPNCRRLHLDNSDYEAASAILEEFDGMIRERALLFKRCAKQIGKDIHDLDAYNLNNPESPLPRLILVIDEVQRLFAGKGAGRFAKLLDNVAAQGRAPGLHLILSTQSMMNYTLDANLLNNIGVRLSFRLNSSTDCSMMFEYGDESAKNLDAYQFIYNADYGRVCSSVIGRSEEIKDVRVRLEAIVRSRAPHQVVEPEVFLSSDDDQESRNDKGMDHEKTAIPTMLGEDLEIIEHDLNVLEELEQSGAELMDSLMKSH